MGQFAKDWEHLKTIIRQKDEAIDRQAAQIAALQQQFSAQQQLDIEDQKAAAELHKTVGDNPPPITAPPPRPAPAVSAPVAPHLAAPPAPGAPHPLNAVFTK
jgi:hypothetical protein